MHRWKHWGSSSWRWRPNLLGQQGPHPHSIQLQQHRARSYIIEWLVLVYSIQRFHHYLYGRPFTVISECEPLETIFKKPLRSALPRLQRMMIRLQGYDVKVRYWRGSDMGIADMLLRLSNPAQMEEIPLDHRVDGVHMDFLNFSMT